MSFRNCPPCENVLSPAIEKFHIKHVESINDVMISTLHHTGNYQASIRIKYFSKGDFVREHLTQRYSGQDFSHSPSFVRKLYVEREILRRS